MSFSFNPVKVVKKAVKTVTKNPLSLVNPITYATTIGLGGKQEKVPESQEDPRLTSLRKQLTTEAKSFREGIPDYTTEQYRGLLPQARDTLSTGLDAIRIGANNRGMLFSGIRENEEQNLRAQIASRLAAQQKEINQEAEDIATAKEKSAAAVGLSHFGSAIESSERLFNLRLENAINRRKALSDLGQGLGYGLGAYAARGKSGGGLLLDEDEFYNRKQQPGGGELLGLNASQEFDDLEFFR